MADPLPRHERPLDRRGPTGLTLTELLVALALSLVVMGAVASLFGLFGRAVKQSQATMNLSALMRSAAWQLRQDLAGVTCPLRPWLSPAANAGYFELLEGPGRDTTYAVDGQGQPTENLTADTDDILLFTTQSLVGAFAGRFAGGRIESPYAEVAWFCRPSATQSLEGTTLYDLHRRQLLVVNYLGRSDYADNAMPLATDRATCDLSLRRATIDGQGPMLIPNSLGDLTKRENRFMRAGFQYATDGGGVRSIPPQAFPFAFPVQESTRLAIAEAALADTRRSWQDVVLTNVIGFDVRVFDPGARIPDASAEVVRSPGELGYVAPAGDQPDSGTGAYVDLGWGGGPAAGVRDDFPPTGQSAFQSGGVAVSDAPRRSTLPAATYDTWSRHYEFNGVDDDGDGTVDEGAHGLDSDGNGWPEISDLAETSPPYPVPLRGLEVRLRCYEPASRQVRQITIRHAFNQ